MLKTFVSESVSKKPTTIKKTQETNLKNTAIISDISNHELQVFKDEIDRLKNEYFKHQSKLNSAEETIKVLNDKFEKKGRIDF